LQKRSHKLLASALLRTTDGFHSKRFEWAFLFGSFQPDCNPFTYLRGALHTRKLQGHHFHASRPYIHSRILKLQQCSQWKTYQYYTLGKLTHYLSDAFTSSHNPVFRIGLTGHHRYESHLRHYLSEHLSCATLHSQETCRNPMASIDELHRQYLASGGGVHRDTYYILQSAELLISSLLSPSPVG